MTTKINDNDSATPLTDDAWESYNRKACGLHYIAHKMRAMEIALRRVLQWCEQDSPNCEIDAEAIRAVLKTHNADYPTAG